MAMSIIRLVLLGAAAVSGDMARRAGEGDGPAPVPRDEWYARFESIEISNVAHKVPQRPLEFTALIKYESNVNLRLGVQVEQGGGDVIIGEYTAMTTSLQNLDPPFCYRPAIQCEIGGVREECPLLCHDWPEAPPVKPVTTTAEPTTAEPTTVVDAEFCVIAECNELGASASLQCPIKCPPVLPPPPPMPPSIDGMGCCAGDDSDACSWITDPAEDCFVNGRINEASRQNCPRACLQCRPCEQDLELRLGNVYVTYTVDPDTAGAVAIGSIMRVKFFLLPRYPGITYLDASQTFDVRVIAGTVTPSAAPTSSAPSAAPTTFPTSSQPTASPTSSQPTASPTSPEPTAAPTFHPTANPTTLPTSPPTLSTCVSDKSDAWEDSDGLSCQDYIDRGYCACNGPRTAGPSGCIGDGSIGPNWLVSTLGEFADYASNATGHVLHAGTACCACGGGVIEVEGLSHPPTAAPSPPCCEQTYTGDNNGCSSEEASSCSDERFGSLCRIACGTCRFCDAPTFSPITSEPTAAPTAEPTAVPTPDACSHIECSDECAHDAVEDVTCGWDRSTYTCKSGFETQAEEVGMGSCFPSCCAEVAALSDHNICVGVTHENCHDASDDRIATLCPRSCRQLNCSVAHCRTRVDNYDGSGDVEPPLSMRPTQAVSTDSPTSPLPTLSPTSRPTMVAIVDPVESCQGVASLMQTPCIPERAADCFPAVCQSERCSATRCADIPQTCTGTGGASADGLPCQGANRCMQGTCSGGTCWESRVPQGTPCESETNGNLRVGYCAHDEGEHEAHCEPVATAEPSSAPSPGPTSVPTAAPATPEPTPAPTAAPATPQPTSAPTLAPTTAEPTPLTARPTSGAPTSAPTITVTQPPLTASDLTQRYVAAPGDLLIHSELGLTDGPSAYDVLSSVGTRDVIKSGIRDSLREAGMSGSVDVYITYAGSVTRGSRVSMAGTTYIEYAVYRHGTTDDVRSQIESILASPPPLYQYTALLGSKLAADLGNYGINVVVSDPPVADFMTQAGDIEMTASAAGSGAAEDDDSLSNTATILVVLIVVSVVLILGYVLKASGVAASKFESMASFVGRSRGFDLPTTVE